MRYSIEAEQSVIGALIIDGNRASDVMEIISDADFYNIDHASIFRGIQFLSNSNNPIDVISLSESLQDAGSLEGIGGIGYLVEIANNATSAANVLVYAQIIADRSMERKISEAGQRIFELGESDGNVDDKLNSLHGELAGLERKDDGGYISFDQILKTVIKDIDDKERGIGKAGMMTGFKELDARFGGIEETDLWILAARPAMGKTALALNIASDVALHGKDVLIFSLEMSKQQLAMRLLSAASDISYQKLRNAETKDSVDKIKNGIKKIIAQKIHIIDVAAIDINRAIAIARKYARGGNLGLVVIDYLQLMTCKSASRFEEVSQISRQLKVLAKTVKAPVLALSQLSRKCEERGDKRPNNSDLRESGQIEQDADIITFIYRDDVYDQNSLNKNIAEIITTKFRNGNIGRDLLSTRLDVCRFEDLDLSKQYVEQTQSTTKSYARKLD